MPSAMSEGERNYLAGEKFFNIVKKKFRFYRERKKLTLFLL